MASSTPHNQLAAAITGILNEYADGVTTGVKEAVQKTTKDGAKMVQKEAAKKFGNGPYAKSWTFKYESDRLGSSGVIYSKKPGLPHLLENGHMLRNGRLWEGRPHISTAEEKIAEEFEEEVLKSI